MSEAQVLATIRLQQGAMTIRGYAAWLGISAMYLCDIYSGRRKPGPKILERFGITKTRVVRYEYEANL